MGHLIEPSRKKLVILFGLLLASHSSIAQNGYNYPRPEVPLTASGTAIPPTTGSTGVRPVVGYPTAAPANFPTSPGYTGTVNPTAQSFGFTNPQRTGSTFTSTATGFAGGRPTADIPTTGFPTASGIGKRPTIPSRTSSIYGSVPTGLGPQQIPKQEEDQGDYSAIPGQPLIDYPIYAEVPPTSFQCNQQQYSGYYADMETQCQVYHVCTMNRTYSFLCPNGTIFSQEHLVCVWWNMFDCSTAPELYANNGNIFNPKPTETEPIPAAYGPITSRPQSGFQTSVRAPTGTGAGVFSANVRPTVPSASYSGVSPGVSAVGTTAFPTSATGSGRFTSSASTAAAGAFPTGPPTTAPAFGTTLRAGYAPIQEAAFPSSQVSPTTANREYLPPRRS